MYHGKKLGNFIGSGTFGVVHELTEETVIRESTDELDGFRAVYWLTDEDRENFCLPKILEIDEEEYNWGVLEKLYPVGSVLFQEFGERDWDIINSNQTCLIDVKNSQLKDLLNKAFELYHYAKEELGIPISNLDLHPSNIMQRKNGSLVLSDPFAQLDI